MTFIPFILSLMRFLIFPKERAWENTIDSFQPIDIGYLSAAEEKKSENVDIQGKIDTISELQEKIKKI
jgi:hypothetical protein